jgi:hypothetical protein
MHRHERRERMAGLRDQIRKRDVRGWATDYLAALAAAGGTQFDDPNDLADLVADLPRPLLIALDVDGVLAPIVAHPDHAALTTGIHDVLGILAARPDLRIAVVSGRTVADLARFEFPSTSSRVIRKQSAKSC